MSFAGIDFSSHTIDVVILDDDTDQARWERVRLDEPPIVDAFSRARRVRTLMPTRSRWEDAGVHLIAIEKPMTKSFTSAAALMRVQGAILAMLPTSLPVLELTPIEWKRETVGKAMASKDDVRAWALERWHWTTYSRPQSQDPYDAYAIAHAARAICDRAAQAAA